MKSCLLGAVFLSAVSQAPAGSLATLQRPVIDTYFDRKGVDNYRWLEDANDPEVQAWFKAQGDYSKQALD